MYGILGEDSSDVATLKVLVRRLADDESLPIRTKGYSGCAQMLRKGASQLRTFLNLGCSRFIICHDADGPDPEPNRERVRTRIIKPSDISDDYCIVVPVQELEAWILADIECATNIFSSWKPTAIHNPEAIPSPKEHLKKLCRTGHKRRRYFHTIHNEQMAKHLDLQKISRKCPAFRELEKFVA